MNGEKLSKTLSPFNVWALALGCIIGSGAFFLAGNKFLPNAGTLGTTIAIALASVLILIIAVNYGYMIQHYPSSGGEFIYAKELFGNNHAFWCAWFLGLSYLILVPFNATALAYIFRSIFGDVFQIGFHYSVAGYEIYLGELLLSETAVILFAIISIAGAKKTGLVQNILVILLVSSVAILFISMILRPEFSIGKLQPAYFSEGNRLSGVLAVMVVAPFAFVGFDTIPQAAEEYKFSHSRTLFFMALSIIFGGFIYIFLNLFSAAGAPSEYANWQEYIADLGNLDGLKSLPTFYSAYNHLGYVGLTFVVIAVTAAVLSGIVGFYMATSRLLFSLACNEYLPEWFGKVDKKHSTPANAIKFICVLAIFLPLAGRNVLGWIVDMSSTGAAIGYGYTSIAAALVARKEKKTAYMITGILGGFFSICFLVLLLVPISGLNCSMGIESYICMLIWTVIGFVLHKKK